MLPFSHRCFQVLGWWAMESLLGWRWSWSRCIERALCWTWLTRMLCINAKCNGKECLWCGIGGGCRVLYIGSGIARGKDILVLNPRWSQCTWSEEAILAYSAQGEPGWGWPLLGVTRPLRGVALTALPSIHSYMYEYLIPMVFYYYPQLLNIFENFICYFLK